MTYYIPTAIQKIELGELETHRRNFSPEIIPPSLDLSHAGRPFLTESFSV
jgi:hypothetical protein